ncbi:D-hexose-6-phosphate mutarotase [Utexia brackfieldae]|uniref:D-hexose-6-phosphate mutarotase n=1 Tax=Utexia brackfieldae TaxID=3074108 RepID=UPI00370DC6EB
MLSTILTNPEAKLLGQSLFTVQQDELTLLVIKHRQCEAILSLQGAQLLSWRPSEQARPVIWLSEKAQFMKGKAIRGGIPLCWPWFNKLGTPSHGFFRTSLWQLVEHQEDETGVTLTLRLEDNSETRKLWVHPFKATVTVKLGQTCYLELTTEGEFSATGALHSYFDVTDIEKITVTGLGIDYQESLTTVNLPQKTGELSFDQAVDRIYTVPAPISLIHDTDRTIKITHHHSHDVVTWNPWQAASIAMADMADDGFKRMVCVETACITTPLVSHHNQPAKIAVTIACE